MQEICDRRTVWDWLAIRASIKRPLLYPRNETADQEGAQATCEWQE